MNWNVYSRSQEALYPSAEASINMEVILSVTELCQVLI